MTISSFGSCAVLGIGIATLASCRPSMEAATKAASDFDARSRSSALARLESDHASTLWTPPLRIVAAADAKPVEATEAALRGCLFAVGGELGFDEAACHPSADGSLELRYYQSGTKVLVVRFVSFVEDEQSYDDSQCLQSGLGGGNQQPERMIAPEGAAAAAAAAPRTLRVLGAIAAADVSVREVRYPIHVVAKICTGTYRTLGYPP